MARTRLTALTESGARLVTNRDITLAKTVATCCEGEGAEDRTDEIDYAVETESHGE